MILVDIKARQDDLYDMHVGDEGDHFVNSNQGYSNVEDCIAIARRLWPPMPEPGTVRPADPHWFDGTPAKISQKQVEAVISEVHSMLEPVVMRVTFRDGKTRTERLR